MVMVSMEAGRECGCRDDSVRLPALSLGLSSVRLIVNKFESQYRRVISETDDTQSRELVKYDPNIDSGYEDYDDFPLGRPRGSVWSRFIYALGLAFSQCIPSVSFANFGVLAVASGIFAPRMISYLVLYPFCRLVFGTLYPAYASYKAVRTKNLKEYVKWMMYWIVFALFTCTETFTDVFLSWFPFYYEVKIVLVLWLLSPATKGSSILYRKFVHPALCRREQEIDEYIAKAKDQGYHTVLNLGTKGVNYATTVIMQTAIKGGGGLVQQLRKSYSLSDLSECEPRDERSHDEADDVMTEPRLIRRTTKGGYVTRRSASESNSRSPIYFPEVDVDVRPRPRSDEPDFSHIKSTEDISSGYSSADNSGSLSRTASLGAGARARSRTTRTTVTSIKRPQAAEEGEVIIEELRDDDGFEYANMPALLNSPCPVYLAHSDPPFLYQYVGDQIKIIQVLGNNPLDPNQTKVEVTDEQKESPVSEVIEQKTDVDSNVTQTSEVKNETTEAYTNTVESHNETEKPVSVDEVKITAVDNNTESQNETEIFVETSDEINREIIEVSHKANSETINDVKLDNIASNAVEHDTKFENVDIISKVEVDTDTKLEHVGSISKDIDNPLKDNDSAESDDEASFGTPENSPKSKKKNVKGKYGKSKAPPPPTIENNEVIDEDKSKVDINITEVKTSQESLNDIVNRLPNTLLKETGPPKGLQIINPFAENKRRHKSKSPGRIPKGNPSGISRLLQLPSKLAFWNKHEDKPKSDASVSSGDRSDHSRRSSSNVEFAIVDEFQSCADLSTIAPNVNDDASQTEKDDETQFIDAVDNEAISHDIIEKSDALQKLIEAKLESHPEYKIVSLHEEIPTTSKSTDV